ncbi:MAG: glycine C-acetyltransferase [bacterium]
MNDSLLASARDTLKAISDEGLFKMERILQSPQDVAIRIGDQQLLSFCTNNYLGLANDPGLIHAVSESLSRWGYGLASVRFISGTQQQHKELEEAIASFFQKEDAILYSSCFDANGGIFEALLDQEDCILSDALNHASIIDGTRLAKCEVQRYRHSDMNDLESQLRLAEKKRIRLIVTDGVFSMDGDIARLEDICALAEKYHAAVMVDDSHGTGVLGVTGRGSPEHTNTLERIDIITSTLGKALGGASGGMTVASKPIIDLLRQRSRPYLFSNTLPPPIVAGALHVFRHFADFLPRLTQLHERTQSFRTRMRESGFPIVPGIHPIVPIMLGVAQKAKIMAEALLQRGVFVVGFWFPVVPRGKARIRVQLSAIHTEAHLDQAIRAFLDARDMHAPS